MKAGIAAAAVALAAAAVPDQPAPMALRDLAVPPGRLPAACALAASPRPVAGVSIPTNPWTGADRPLVASIRELIDGSPPPPDGPPLSRGELASYRLHLADGIDQAYAAVFEERSGARLVTVLAVEFAEGEPPTPPVSRRAPGAQTVRVVKGRIVAVVSGQGPCFDAVATYIKSLPD